MKQGVKNYHFNSSFCSQKYVHGTKYQITIINIKEISQIGFKMNNEQHVIEFYVICNKLKDVIRSGWRNWNVRRERLESVAEHVYGVQMLAIAMCAEFGYDIDLKKVILMLAIHELEETVIGDLNTWEITPENKKEKGHLAVAKILDKLANAETIKEIIFEFDENKTPEAKFANQCDKLECDIQCKLYDEQNCVDLTQQQNNKFLQIPEIKNALETNKSWSAAWLKLDQQKYNFDEIILKISNYILKNKIS